MPGWRFGKRKKGRNRPPDEGHQERRVPLEQAQAVLEVASALVDGSVVNMPILKPVFEAARQVITICQAMRSNKDDAASLAHEVQEFLQHLSDALVTEVQEHIDGRLQADLNKFTDALEKIHIRLRKLSGRSKAANFWRYKSDRDTINDCRRILNHDGKLFMFSSAIQLRMDGRRSGIGKQEPNVCVREQETVPSTSQEHAESLGTCIDQHGEIASRGGNENTPLTEGKIEPLTSTPATHIKRASFGGQASIDTDYIRASLDVHVSTKLFFGVAQWEPLYLPLAPKPGRYDCSWHPYRGGSPAGNPAGTAGVQLPNRSNFP